MIEINVRHKDGLVDYYEPNIARFPDGTPKIDLPEYMAISDSGTIIRLIWKFDSMEELFNLCAIKDALDTKYASYTIVKELYMPYIPNARMDRVKAINEVFTLKTFCRIINSLNFNHVIVNNAHSDVSKALLNNCVDLGNQTIEQTILEALPVRFDTIMFPDNGACKRYSEIKGFKYFDIIVGNKKRDWKTGVIQGLEIIGNPESIKDKDIIIIDDICSRGGTYKFSAIELKKLGAKDIYLYVSHCENVIDVESLKAAGVTKVFTTDSIYRSQNDFVQIIETKED